MKSVEDVDVEVDAHERERLNAGWEIAWCPPDAQPRLQELEWLPAIVPGTAAAAMRDAGRWKEGERYDFDSVDWWFRCRFDAAAAAEGEEAILRLSGIATRSEVFLNGSKVLESDSMFVSHCVNAGDLLDGSNELTIRCMALGPILKRPRKPRARWRTKLVNGGLRFERTMLLGRAEGFAPWPAAVGPWRPIEIVRRRLVAVEDLKVRTAVEARAAGGGTRAAGDGTRAAGDGTRAAGDGARAADESGIDGLLSVDVALRALEGETIESVKVTLSGPSGEHSAPLDLSAGEDGRVQATGTLSVPHVALWWPHTHGQPNLHSVRLTIKTAGESVSVNAGRVGFRTLTAGAGPHDDVEAAGLHLHVNGVPIFARGAVWVTPDPVGLAPDAGSLHAALKRAVDAGMNMLRIVGTSAYESGEFHELCDELGLLVWQDFMFANLDYPIEDEGFATTVETEATQQLDALASHPSLAVLCGNSEVEQQVSMLGLHPDLGRGRLFGELLPRLIAESGCEAIYVPSSPCGGTLPFRPHTGIAHYFGVGGYLRPIEDARRAEVKFASECLALSNVPDEAGVSAVLGDGGAIDLRHPSWKEGVPRDAGADWDFEDVRDHYLKLLFDVDPDELRDGDPERYLELSRAVSGETMASVLGEWRRERSSCNGALILWLSDLVPGAGWGVIDRSGTPKVAYHHVRRALAPIAVWMIDEGLGGVTIHVCNDRETPLTACLRVSLYRDGELKVGEAVEEIELPPHSGIERDVEGLLRRFVDVSWAYRFGPPAQDVIVASLERQEPGGELISQAFHFPAGRPLRQESAAELGLEATVDVADDGIAKLSITSKRLAYGVRLHARRLRPADDAFSVEPGGRRVVELGPLRAGSTTPPEIRLTGLNMRGVGWVAVADQRSTAQGTRHVPEGEL